jgi:uncharacterized RDD family membrane protein YckC/ribosomal protein L40E
MEQHPPGDIWGDIQKQHEVNTNPPSAGNPPSSANKYCHHCGTLLPASAFFCPRCGTKQSMFAAADNKICAGCHAVNEVSSQFCYKCGLKLPEQAGVYVNVEYGGFWLRFCAYLIDSTIISVATGLFTIPWVVWMNNLTESAAYKYAEDTSAMDTRIGLWTLLMLLGIILVAVAYYTIAVGKWGKTLGKMAVGLKVVKADGEKVSYARALGRYLAYILNGFTFYLSFLIIAFTPKKRGLHDYIADTIVVKSR